MNGHRKLHTIKKNVVQNIYRSRIYIAESFIRFVLSEKLEENGQSTNLCESNQSTIPAEGTNLCESNQSAITAEGTSLCESNQSAIPADGRRT
jgi:hypothetical protein